MKYKILGKTNLEVSEVSFGALPIQRVSISEATAILRRAYDGGVNYFDTARAYTDSEQKLGFALKSVRSKVIISSKTMATTGEQAEADLKESLKQLKTDYIDLYQHHNPGMLSDPQDESGVYAYLQKAKKEGKIRHIGITQHKLALAEMAIQSGLYETLQFPLSYISDEREIALVAQCEAANMGYIAMKALGGGMLTHIDCAYAFFAQESMKNAVPIWGAQSENEIDEFLSYSDIELELSDEMRRRIETDKQELSGNFCRACGYCLPCTENIDIPQCSRMKQLIRRMPYEQFITEEWRQKMRQIEKCTGCLKCAKRCPYSLNAPELLKENLRDYDEFIENLK